MEKDIDFGVLLSFYGKMLTERQLDVMERYYLYDNSLGEIAEITGITRQSVRDAILKAKKTLAELEEKLGFRSITYEAVRRLAEVRNLVADMPEAAQRIDGIVRLLEE